jgi:hypothetical protein
VNDQACQGVLGLPNGRYEGKQRRFQRAASHFYLPKPNPGVADSGGDAGTLAEHIDGIGRG